MAAEKDSREADKHGERAWDALIEKIANGEKSIFETIHEWRVALWADDDHERFVMAMRALHMMIRDKRVQEQLLEETRREFERVIGPKPNYAEEQERQILAKDGFRLYRKLSDVQADAYANAPPLIECGRTFKEALATYHRLVEHVENIWNDACDAYRVKRYPLAVFFSILAIEEIGKLGRLWFDLLAWDRPDSEAGKPVPRRHPQKHFLALVPGTVINARLDRVLGVKQLKAVLQDAESGKLERLRQSCLYIDVVDGKAAFPDDAIGEDTAKLYVILAGELWAEVLGNFPWEFEKMRDKVIAFELSIGFDEDAVKKN
jgi:AbiV family abortive infection protein